MIPRIGLAEDRLLRLQICRHILNVCLVIASARRKVQVEQHFGILNNLFIDFDPQLGEGIARLDRAVVIIVDQIQAVLEQLLLSVHARVFELSVLYYERLDPVKILIHLFRRQTEVFLKDLRR